MTNLSVSQRAARMGCPYHQMLLAQTPQTDESCEESAPLDQVTGTVKQHLDNPLKALEELHARFGDAFEVDTPEGKLRFDHDVDTTRKVLMTTEGDTPLFKKSSKQTHGLARLLGDDNVLLASGDDWQSSREALSDFFSLKSMRQDKRASAVAEILDRHFEAAQAALGASGEGPLELSGLLRKATLDVALNTLFSAQVGAQELDTLGKAFEVAHKRVGQEWVLPASLTGLSEPQQEFDKAVSVIDGWAGGLVEGRMKLDHQPDDALSALMRATDPQTGKPYSRGRLTSEVKNLMLAGHETTANLITWTLAEVARNPLKQNEIFKQIQDVTQGGIPDTEQLRKLDKVYNTWREEAVEHPPNFLLARVALQDTTVGPKEHPVEIKAGTTVIVSMQHANSEEGANMFSFGGGRRFCLGVNLARLETEMAVTRFLQRFEVTDTGAVGMRSGLTQNPEDSLVSVKTRKP